MAEKIQLAFSIIYKSCNRVLIEKTYWKSVEQQKILNAGSDIVWSRERGEEKLQIVEADPESTGVYNGGIVIWGNWVIHR